MIYKNLIEEIPQKKRIRKFSNVHYVYEIISRKNGTVQDSGVLD